MNLEALCAWMRTHVDGSIGMLQDARRIGGGWSNLTYEVSDGERAWVVRRGPEGAFLPTAHDMSREYRFYRALAQTDVPVPRAYGYCDDASVIGAPFYVMERMAGVVPETVDDAEQFDPDERRRCAIDFVDVLARLHAVDFTDVGLADIARHDGYLERQLRRWADQWERSKTAEVPEMDELFRRLGNALPADHATTIVHGDYRLGNVMLSLADRGRLNAVFDWEMATLGDPIADVGYTLIYWGASDIALHTSQAVADLPGFFDRTTLIEEYCRRSGRAVDQVDFYVILAHVKLAIIGQGGIVRRMRAAGQDPAGASDGLPARMQRILDIADRSSMPALR